MIPSRWLVLLAIAPVVLALMTLFDETLLWTMLATDAGILLVALADAAMAWQPLVSVKRHARDVFSIGQRNLVTLELRSRSRRTLRVSVNDDLFDDAETDETQ